jgi:hypothetical protein
MMRSIIGTRLVSQTDLLVADVREQRVPAETATGSAEGGD